MTKEDLKKRIEQANRMIGRFGEHIVLENQQRNKWEFMETHEYFPQMVDAGIANPASLVDLGLRQIEFRTDEETWELIEIERWELIQVKTICIKQPELEFIQVPIPEQKLRRYISQAKQILSDIECHCAAPDLVPMRFPVETKIAVYMVLPIGIYSIDILDLQRYTRKESDPGNLRVYIGDCEGPLEPWHSDKRNGRWTYGAKLEEMCRRKSDLVSTIKDYDLRGLNGSLFE